MSAPLNVLASGFHGERGFLLSYFAYTVCVCASHSAFAAQFQNWTATRYLATRVPALHLPFAIWPVISSLAVATNVFHYAESRLQ